MQDEPKRKVRSPSAARWVAMHDATARAAIEIIERARDARYAKMARLRAARLARETGTNGSGAAS